RTRVERTAVRTISKRPPVPRAAGARCVLWLPVRSRRRLHVLAAQAAAPRPAVGSNWWALGPCSRAVEEKERLPALGGAARPPAAGNSIARSRNARASSLRPWAARFLPYSPSTTALSGAISTN